MCPLVNAIPIVLPCNTFFFFFFLKDSKVKLVGNFPTIYLFASENADLLKHNFFFVGKYLFQYESFSDSELNFWRKKKKKKVKDKLSHLFFKIDSCSALRHSPGDTGERGLSPSDSVCQPFSGPAMQSQTASDRVKGMTDRIVPLKPGFSIFSARSQFCFNVQEKQILKFILFSKIEMFCRESYTNPTLIALEIH